MGRALRHHYPGSAFHIVARIQGHRPRFTNAIKDDIADLLLRGTASVGSRPIAFAVMDNHFHLILLQGPVHLGETMQPIMRRIALMVQKRHDCEGHVFERRYRSKVCADSEHLPNAILYVHRNPVKAGMCRTASEYRWSSARVFDGGSPPGLICVEEGLRAFDPLGSSPLESLREIYKERLATVRDPELDAYWTWFTRVVRRRRTGGKAHVPSSPHVMRATLADLRDVALRVLRTIDEQVPVELVRSRYGGSKIAAIRTQLMAALLQRGYPGVDIARYLRISEATVSKVKSAMRWGSLPPMTQ